MNTVRSATHCNQTASTPFLKGTFIRRIWYSALLDCFVYALRTLFTDKVQKWTSYVRASCM